MSARNKRIRYHLIACIVGISLLLGACSPPAPAPTTPTQPPSPPPASVPTAVPVNLATISQADLVGTWQWVGGREPISAPTLIVPKPENYTITFNEDGTLNIKADCNSVRGDYKLSGDQLTITLGASTMVACEPASLSDQFLNQLGQASRVGTGFGNLVIVTGDNTGQMYFQRASLPALGADLKPVTQNDLVDILWQWTNLVETAPAAETGVGDPSNYDLVFRIDGTYSAKADCNQLNGTYELLGAKLTLNPGITTLAMCGPESKYDLYKSLLARVTGVGNREGLLVLLLDGNAGAMSFVNGGKAPAAPVPQAIQGDPALVLGPPDGTENFDNANNWSTFDSACFKSEITGGQFVMTANGIPQTVCWEVSWPELGNFYMDTTLRMPETCDPQDRFGLLFRAPDTNRGYMYGFNCAGQYSLTIWDGEATTTLVEPTASDSILKTPGARNSMGLLVFGEDISLYANGVFLQTVTDFTYLEPGRFGYFVRAATDKPFTVSYDQLRIWSLEDELFPPAMGSPLPPVDLPNPPSNVPTGEARVNVNVRTGPSMLFPILGTAQQGDTGEIVGINPDGFWYAVKVPTTMVGTGIAWVSADFVNLTNPTGKPLQVVTPPLLPTTVNFPTPPQSAQQVTMREPATIRSGPTLEFPVFGVAPTGSRAEVIGQSQDREWWAIRIPTSLAGNGTAWVPKVFTTAINAGNVPVVQTPELPRNITPAAPASGAPALVTIEPLNVRAGPTNAYPSLGRVARGTVMSVVGISPDREWFVVNIPTDVDRSGRGWVAARFVRAENVGNVPVVQPPPLP
jgi:heat shock protein HslJ/uncharacterized protein YraI